jgi:hypothetical protein
MKILGHIWLHDTVYVNANKDNCWGLKWINIIAFNTNHY